MIDFPNSPTIGQTFTSGAASWTWDGAKWAATGSGSGGGITQLTGDVTAGPGSGSQAATLASTAVTAGSYTSANITVDAKGRLTAAANGVPAHPGYRSGTYYTRPISAAGTNAAVSANRIYLAPILIGSSVTVDAAQIYVGTLAAGNAELGIYGNGTGVPGTLIRDFGTVSTGATGIVVVSGFTQALSAGWYWLAAGFSATPSIVSSASTDVSQQHLLGVAGLITSFQGYQGWIANWTFSAGGLPSTPASPTIVNSSVPLIAFRAQ